MKNSIGTFTDLNGKTVNIETAEQLAKLIEMAVFVVELNNTTESALPEEITNKIKAYWHHRLLSLELIANKHANTTKTA